MNGEYPGCVTASAGTWLYRYDEASTEKVSASDDTRWTSQHGLLRETRAGNSRGYRADALKSTTARRSSCGNGRFSRPRCPQISVDAGLAVKINAIPFANLCFLVNFRKTNLLFSRFRAATSSVRIAAFR